MLQKSPVEEREILHEVKGPQKRLFQLCFFQHCATVNYWEEFHILGTLAGKRLIFR